MGGQVKDSEAGGRGGRVHYFGITGNNELFGRLSLIANADIVLNFVPVSLRSAGQHINPLTVVLQLLCLSTLRLRSLSKASRPPRRRWL